MDEFACEAIDAAVLLFIGRSMLRSFRLCLPSEPMARAGIASGVGWPRPDMPTTDSRLPPVFFFLLARMA
eukprot:scaffold28233_cov112-Isochrysis_galbana.AAC.2